jgi:hypothetical protein
MAHARDMRTPKWRRWMPLAVTSPTGKTLFVCLVCGTITPAPNIECSPHLPQGVGPLDVRLDQELHSCADVERYLNQEIEKNLDPRLLLDWAENQLLPYPERRCSFCHGHGCQVCVGRGRNRC